MGNEDFRWLLIDSCGTAATLAVGRGEMTLATETIAGRAFSAEWPAALRRLLEVAGWSVAEMQVIGIVHGPGSFTGVRVGLAVAKGLCEAAGAKLVALSRLEVLAERGVAGGLAVLGAGRDEFYVRDAGIEFLAGREELSTVSQGRTVVTYDEGVAKVCAGAIVVQLDAVSALPIMLRRWSEGRFDDAAAIDANYVRGERDMYARKPAASQNAK